MAGSRNTVESREINSNGSRDLTHLKLAPQTLSVSASDHSNFAEVSVSASPNGTGFLSPRVLDQRAFDELSRTLRGLVKDANIACEELSQTIQEAERRDRASVGSAQQLQEQIRLSARLLKAVQVQSETLANVSKTAQESAKHAGPSQIELDAQTAAFERRVESLIKEAERRIDETIEVRVNELFESRKAAMLGEFENQLAEALPQGERLSLLVEKAEVNIAALAHRSAENIQKADETAGECERSAVELRRILSDADATAQTWSAVLEQFSQTIGEIVTAESRDESDIDIKLPPATLQSMVDQLRESIGRDVQQLQAAVQSIASQVNSMREPADNHAPRMLNAVKVVAATTPTPQQCAEGAD